MLAHPRLNIFILTTKNAAVAKHFHYFLFHCISNVLVCNFPHHTWLDIFSSTTPEQPPSARQAKADT
jgi:hypothetical protein